MTERTAHDRSGHRRLFVEPSRLLGRLYFYTSSIEKYLQARLVFDRNGLTVDYFKSQTDPYDEDYAGTTADLLRQAIAQVTDRVGRGRLVFVEDTSVRIEALSGPERDFPGMQIKHWFADTSFDALDRELRARGNDRRAVIKSDIALKVPGLDQALLFHGETAGTVADHAPTFLMNPQYPWLTPATFNGWFVPDGCDQPLGALPLEESLRHDFRARAFERLIDRLEEYATVLNLPATAIRKRRTLRSPTGASPSLFDQASGPRGAALLVVGRTCAGKTTLAEYVSGRHGLLYIEASSIVRSLDVPHLPRDDVDGFSFAMRALDELGHDIVAREIVARYGDRLEGPFVVSGLRDIAEIEYMRSTVPRVNIVLIEASERTRLERHTRRARLGAETKLSDFRRRDLRQNAFGLLPVIEDLADTRIVNEEGIEAYHHQIDALLVEQEGVQGLDLAVRPRHGPDHHQLFRCLRILGRAGCAMQCDEIEAQSASEGRTIRHNNANKVLRAVPALAERIDPPDRKDSVQDTARVRYRITSAGEAFVRLFEARQAQFTQADTDATDA